MNLKPLTKEQALILTAYTGVDCMVNIDDFIEFMIIDFDPHFHIDDLESRRSEIRDFYSEDFYQIVG